MVLPYSKQKPSVGGLALMVPANGNKPDFVIIGDHTRLSVKASLWFKVRATVQHQWVNDQLKKFAEANEMSEPILVIIDYDHQVIKPK